MKILNAVRSGAARSLSLWKGALIVLLITLLMVLLMAIPMKGVLKTGFGSSMIVEKLRYGFDVEFFTDPGTAFKSLIASFKNGILFIIPVSFIVNAFLTGGLFGSLSKPLEKFSSSLFWRASAKNFWSFLIILLVAWLIIILLALLTIVLPLSIVSSNENFSEVTFFRTGILGLSVFIFLLTVIMLVTDYARAWQVKLEKNLTFRAIGFGFGQTFRTFRTSWPLMILILIIQMLYWWLAGVLFARITPTTGWGVFLFFLLFQFLFFFRILLKISRYGSVTSLMEQNQKVVITEMGIFDKNV
jgi:hypothetical protein